MEGKEAIDVFHNIDLTNPHFVRTPIRMQKWIDEYTTLIPIEEIVKKYCVTFPSDINNSVEVKVHNTYMLCPHHFLPVDMTITITYIPNGKILGLSKFF